MDFREGLSPSHIILRAGRKTTPGNVLIRGVLKYYAKLEHMSLDISYSPFDTLVDERGTVMDLIDYILVKAYCSACGIATWQLLCKDGHFKCLVCQLLGRNELQTQKGDDYANT